MERGDRDNIRSSFEDESFEAYEERRRLRRAEHLKRRKRKIRLMKLGLLLGLALVIICVGVIASHLIRKPGSSSSGRQADPAAASAVSSGTAVPVPVAASDAKAQAEQTADAASADSSSPEDAPADAAAPSADDASAPDAPAETESAAPASSQDDIMERARITAAGYDYDGAIELLHTIPEYETNSDVLAAITEYEEARDACVAADVNTVPHIFYHSLVNDTDRAFNVSVLGQSAVNGMNAWMTTVDEFDKITQQLYDNGYVYVRLRDLVVETVGDDGVPHFTPNTQLMLPPGKKPIVLSVDDLSYYHSYKPAGFPEKLVLDENGLVKCRYTDGSGNTTVGDYDVVPRLNTFLREHPDGAYHGARGLIALTGYNGVFGYRTDTDYEARANLMHDQAQWLEENPDFNIQTEISEATVIADAIKAEGWEFASHTWGHISVTHADAEKLAVDNEKWMNTVANITGPSDTIIFAHGNDIGSWEGYTSDNQKYAYYNSAGYHFYCNVDGSVPYWVQIADTYVRQGRIDLDGYMLYRASQGQTDVLNNLIDPASVFDQRRPVPVVAEGQG